MAAPFIGRTRPPASARRPGRRGCGRPGPRPAGPPEAPARLRASSPKKRRSRPSRLCRPRHSVPVLSLLESRLAQSPGAGHAPILALSIPCAVILSVCRRPGRPARRDAPGPLRHRDRRPVRAPRRNAVRTGADATRATHGRHARPPGPAGPAGPASPPALHPV